MDTSKAPEIPRGLSELVKGKDHLTTREFAPVVRLKEASVRKSFRIRGHSCGVVPVIVGKTLLWPVSEVLRLFTAER